MRNWLLVLSKSLYDESLLFADFNILCLSLSFESLPMMWWILLSLSYLELTGLPERVDYFSSNLRSPTAIISLDILPDSSCALFLDLLMHFGLLDGVPQVSVALLFFIPLTFCSLDWIISIDLSLNNSNGLLNPCSDFCFQFL